MLLGESTFAPGRLQMPIMDGQAMLVECPAFLGHGAVRCGLPAEVEERYTLGSTDGPLPSARIRCPRPLVQRAHRSPERDGITADLVPIVGQRPGAQPDRSQL